MRASETTTTGLEGLPEEKEARHRDRIAACDAEGLPAALGISTSKAIRLISRHREEEAKANERKVLRTGDARRLKRELLSIFASEASSPLARNSVLFLAPTLDSNEAMRRFGLVVQGREVHDALESSGREEALRKTLARLSFLPVRTDTGGPASSATIRFFLARRQMIESVRQVLAEFGDVGAVMSFLGVSDDKVLAEVRRLTERAGIGKVEDAEAAVSDAEVEINDALRKGVRDRERVLAIIEEKVAEVVAGLGMNLEEEESMRRAALESPSVPFEFDRATTKRAVDAWRKRREEEQAAELRKIEGGLRQKVGPVSALIGKALLLDQVLAVSSAAVKYSLTLPSIGAGGIGFVNARRSLPHHERERRRQGAAGAPASQLRGREDRGDEGAGKATKRRDIDGREQRGKDDAPQHRRRDPHPHAAGAFPCLQRERRSPRCRSTSSGRGRPGGPAAWSTSFAR